MSCLRWGHRSSPPLTCFRSSILAGHCSSAGALRIIRGQQQGWNGRPPPRRRRTTLKPPRLSTAIPTNMQSMERRDHKMPNALPSSQFTDLRQQHEAATLGIWVFLASEVLFFGPLILAYCVYRIDDPLNFVRAAAHTKIVIGAI